ncbi:S4 domain-containing protein [Candidatus Vidania fulgoroideorum]
MKLKRLKLVKRFNNHLCLFSFFSNFKKKININDCYKKSLKRNNEYKENICLNKKLRIFYGIKKKQLNNLIKKKKININKSISNLIFYLEKRFDVFLFRIGFASTIRNAKQIINHGFFKINKKKANLPGILLKNNDLIEIKKKYRNNKNLKLFISQYLKKNKNNNNKVDYLLIKAYYTNNNFKLKHEVLRNEI